MDVPARQKSLQMAAIRGWSTRNWRSRCFVCAFQNSSSHQQESNSDSQIIVIIQRFASLKNVFVTNPSFSFRLQFYTRTAATLPYELKLIEILNSLPDDSFSRTQSLQYISSFSGPYEYLWWTLFATASDVRGRSKLQLYMHQIEFFEGKWCIKLHKHLWAWSFNQTAFLL